MSPSKYVKYNVKVNLKQIMVVCNIVINKFLCKNMKTIPLMCML